MRSMDRLRARRAALRRALTGPVAALALVTATVAALAPTAAGAEAGVPNAPTAIAPYAGVGGVVVTWEPPRGGPAATAYEVQRAVGAGEFAPLATVSAGEPRRYADLQGVPTYERFTYRVVAVNAAGPSAPTRARAVSVPSQVPPATAPNRLILTDYSAASPWPGGVAFDGRTDTVTATRLNDREFEIRGVSAPGSPQGAREVAFTVGSTAYGARLDGYGYETYPTVGPGEPNANLPALYPTTGGQCGDRPGSLSTMGAIFAADGTPLAVDATFEYCGARGRIQWNARQDAVGMMQPAAPRLDFDATGGGSPQTAVFRNVGGGDRALRPSRLDDFGGGVPAGYQLQGDTCGGATVAPGGTCSVTVTASRTSLHRARIVLDDGSTGSPPAVLLTAGPDVPAPPLLMVPFGTAGTWRGVPLSWVPGPSDPPVTTYSIYRGTSAEAMTKIADVGPEANGAYLDRTGVPSTSYVYAVTARNPVGESPQSNVISGRADPSGTFAATTRWSTGTDRDIAVLGADGDPVRLTSDGGDHTEPAVAPTGSAFAYASNHGNDPADYDLWVQPVPGAPRRLTTDQKSSDRDPDISPDGKTIAFTRVAADASTSVWTVPLAGGAPVQIPGSTGDSEPSWAPSGQVLAVSHAGANGSSILVIGLGGGYRHLLAGTDAGDVVAHDPDWTGAARSLGVTYVRTTAAASSLEKADPFTGASTTDPPEAVAARTQAGGLKEGYSSTSGASLWRSDTEPVKGSDEAVFSDPAIAETPTAYVPENVGNLAIASSSIDSGSATVSWRLEEPGTGEGCVVCPRWTIVRRGVAGSYAQLKKPTDGLGVYEGTGTTATATGLTNGAYYSVALFALTAVGDVARYPNTFGVTPAARPVVKPNGTVLSSLYADGPRFTASWGKPLPEYSTYEAQLGTRTLDAKTKTWSAEPTYAKLSYAAAVSKVVTATPGTTYYLRTRVRDNYGSVTPWGPVAVVPVPYDDKAFAASGKWSALTKQKGRFAGTLRETSKAGSALSLTTYGSSFALIADKCATCGKVKIYLDGKLVSTVDTYAKSAAARQSIWSQTFGSIGSHTVKVVAAGTSKRPKVRIDGLVARR